MPAILALGARRKSAHRQLFDSGLLPTRLLCFERGYRNLIIMGPMQRSLGNVIQKEPVVFLLAATIACRGLQPEEKTRVSALYQQTMGMLAHSAAKDEAGLADRTLSFAVLDLEAADLHRMVTWQNWRQVAAAEAC